MDKRIRRNELCIIGLPRCDFVFSSSRTAFIGYGFEESSLEMSLLKRLLVEKGVEPIEAGGSIAPGQNVFCSKICSKIITSQFCIILLNNDTHNEIEIPNANVNMEYGLMLGFNKYVIPFQRDQQKLPFNVSGLDTVKYDSRNFESKAATAIEAAISATSQDTPPPIAPDQLLEAFLLSKHVLVVPILTEGDRNLYELGRPLGYNMLMTFDGLQYLYFGNFTSLRSEAILWRLRTLLKIVDDRIGSITRRVQMGVLAQNQVSTTLISAFVEKLEIWILVTSDDDKKLLRTEIEKAQFKRAIQIFSISDIKTALQNII